MSTWTEKIWQICCQYRNHKRWMKYQSEKKMEIVVIFDSN